MNHHNDNPNIHGGVDAIIVLLICVALFLFTTMVLDTVSQHELDAALADSEPSVCRNEFGHRRNCNENLDYPNDCPYPQWRSCRL